MSSYRVSDLEATVIDVTPSLANDAEARCRRWKMLVFGMWGAALLALCIAATVVLTMAMMGG
jgi:hypothetical protein